MAGELEHRDVAVGVAGGEQWPAADAAPDADRLLWAIVEVVGLGLMCDRATTLVADVFERQCAADHALGGMP